jgi:hypothetical protein
MQGEQQEFRPRQCMDDLISSLTGAVADFGRLVAEWNHCNVQPYNPHHGQKFSSKAESFRACLTLRL